MDAYGNQTAITTRRHEMTTIDWFYDELGRLTGEAYDFDHLTNNALDDDFDSLPSTSTTWRVTARNTMSTGSQRRKPSPAFAPAASSRPPGTKRPTIPTTIQLERFHEHLSLLPHFSTTICHRMRQGSEYSAAKSMA